MLKLIQHQGHVGYPLTGYRETYAVLQIIQMVDECFGVGVVSAARDGVAPALNPGRVHRRMNIHPEVRHAPILF